MLAHVQLCLCHHTAACGQWPTSQCRTVQVPLNEYDFPAAKVANVQSELQRLVERNYYLNQGAKDAYRAYVLAYNSHSLKDIFNVHTLDLSAVAQSFGFPKPPRVRNLMVADLDYMRVCCTALGFLQPSLATTTAMHTNLGSCALC